MLWLLDLEKHVSPERLSVRRHSYGNTVAGFVKPCSTCAVSRYVLGTRLPLGLVVTASHNPGIYNGLKIKEAYGGSATQETVTSVERRIGRSRVTRVPFDEAVKAGTVQVRDIHDNPVASVPLRVTVAPDNASVQATSLSTDAQGMARELYQH